MNKKPIKCLCIIACLFANIAISQNVVLVNGVATKVSLKEGNITSIYDAVPNHMQGFASDSVDGFQKVRPRTGTKAVESAPAILAGPSEIKVNSDYKFNFDDATAVLTESNKEMIGKFASKITEGKASSIQLSTTHKKNDLKNQKLSENRLTAIKKYLQSVGVNSNLILTSVVEGGNSSEHGVVSLLLKK